MYELKKWYFRGNKENGLVTAKGLVLDNPQFSDGSDIHTSTIEKVLIDEENEQFMIVTRSQSYYTLKFAEMNMDALEKTTEGFSLLNIPTVILEKSITCAKDYQEALSQKINAKLQPRELYLIMAGATVLSAYFKRENNELVSANIDVHTGTFQDSVLIDYLDEVDFRYFPKGSANDAIAPYHWSDGLNRIIIKNVGRSLEFRGCDTTFSCKSGEELNIESKDYSGEGLLSPDGVNGKCAFFNDAYTE